MYILFFNQKFRLAVCLCIAYLYRLCYNDCTVFIIRYGDSKMDCGSKMRELRKRTGMNRKEFCHFFEIPYRTVTDWELDNRHAPEYVLHLLEYYIRHENLYKEREGNK